MRLILRNRPSLHVWNVNDYIKQTQANIVKQDTHKYITLQKIFHKIYMRHLRDHERLKVHQNSLDNFVLLSPSPARAITDYFHQKSKEYSEDFLRVTFESLARAYQISKADNNGSLDTLGYSLFLSSQFCNLSEELKFALRNNKLSFQSITSIIDSLLKLEYVDYEIVNLLLLYTRRQLEGGDPYASLKQWPGDREFQIQKKGYYNPQEEQDLKALRDSQEVATAISFVRHIYRQWAEEQQMAAALARSNLHELNTLVGQISSTNKNFRKLVEGIISIRRQYLQMVRFSQQEDVLRNPNLNLDLLELQEKLLATHLLTIEDVKNPENIANPDIQVPQVEALLLRVLGVRRLDPIFAFIDKSGIEVENEKEKARPNAARLSVLLNGLAKLAQLDRHLYHAHDGKSMITLKWEKTLVQQQQSKHLPVEAPKEELNVARIFRRVYKEIYQFVTSNDSKLKEIFRTSIFADRVELVDAYCRLGLSEQAVAHLGKLSEDTAGGIRELEGGKFVSLLHVLNDIGILVNNQSLHSAVKQRLGVEQDAEEQGRHPKPIRFSIDAANYLLQMHRTAPDYSRLSTQALRLLQAKASYVTFEERDNENIVEAFRILALEQPHRFGSHPIYQNYLQRLANDDFKRNPFSAIIREAAYKWAGRPYALSTLQNYLPVGVNRGIQNALLLSSSDETSLDGQVRSGDLNSYILRLQLKNGVRVHELPTNALLDINYATGKNFRLKPLQYLRARLEEIFERQPEQFDVLYESVESNLKQVLEFFPRSLVSDRIRFKIAILGKLRSSSTETRTHEQQFSKKAAFLLEVLELGKLIKLLDEKHILKIVTRPSLTNAPINDSLTPSLPPPSSDTIEVDTEATKLQLRQVRNAMPELIESLSKYMERESSKLQSSEEGRLHGERQSIQLLQNTESKVDLTMDIINMRYYQDKTYCEYQDWKDRISGKYHYSEVNYTTSSTLTKILANRLCGDATNKLHLLPLVKHQDRVQRLDLDFTLLPKAETQATESKQVVSESRQAEKQAERELDYIINLQNFKHQLKAYFTPAKLMDYIFGFKFVADLSTRSPDKERLVLKRDPEQYFKYLQELHNKSYLESPYAQYILGKLGRTDNIRHLLEQRKDLRISLRIQYKKGLINGAEYYSKVEEFEDRIVKELESLKGKLLDHMQDTILPSEFKMVDIKKDELEAFQQLLTRQAAYSRHFDEDFISANGDYQQALQFRRGRAQHNYLRLGLLRKINEGQLLEARQKLQIRKWHEDIARSVTEFVVYPEYTTLQIADLPWEDLQQLKLKHSALNANKDMLVIDLILELSHFLDEGLLLDYERQVKAQYIHKNFKVPPFLLQRTTNPSFRRLEVETEVAITNQQSRLLPHELDRVQEMFKVYKTQGFRERTRYQQLCNRFRSNIQNMNNQSIRNELIHEYIRHLEVEFYKEYDPALLVEIKERETDKLWRSVFQETYDNCNKDLLKDITKKLILRLEAIGQNPPPFFGNMLFKLLLHPNIDCHSRQSLIAAIQIYQFDMNLDSADIEALSKLQGRSVRSSVETKEDLKASTSVKISKQLREKTKPLL